MKTRILFTIILLSLVSLACMVTTTGLEALQPGSILFKDDFSDPSSGWDRVHADTYLMDYSNGFYAIFLAQADVEVWSNPGLHFQDVIIEVDATKAGGPDDNTFGVLCRSNKDGSSFYFFVISSDGYYAIGKVKDGEQALLNANVMQPSNEVHQGDALNHMRADCVGGRLALYVNETKVAEVHDGEFIAGDVGLLAGSFDVPGVYINFENFMVLKP